jgi:ferredoxin
MKAHVDQNKCIGCGLCPGICPEVFAMNSDDLAEVIVDNVPQEAQSTVQEAIESCPAEAISSEK